MRAKPRLTLGGRAKTAVTPGLTRGPAVLRPARQRPPGSGAGGTMVGQVTGAPLRSFQQEER